MKKFLSLAAIASVLFLVSCTAETDTIEPVQNIKTDQNFEESYSSRENDSIGDSTSPSEGQPYIKKDKD